MTDIPAIIYIEIDRISIFAQVPSDAAKIPEYKGYEFYMIVLIRYILVI